MKKLFKLFRRKEYTLGASVFHCRSWMEKQMQEYSINEQWMKNLANRAKQKEEVQPQPWYAKYLD